MPSLWSLLLATLVEVSIQQCVLEDIDVLDLVESNEVELTGLETMHISAIYYNCLSAGQYVGLYSSTSLSVLYYESRSDTLKEVRYNLWCRSEHWEPIGKTNTALRSNDTRTDCYSCTDQSINENHCSVCNSSCTGLNQCYGPSASECCSYDDGGTCTDDCGMNREGNSTFHCVCSNFWTGANCDGCSLTCENNGTPAPDCSRCLCVPGYEGIMCQNQTNECDPNPCENNATCTDMVNEYTCTCVPGYTGSNCGMDIDDCDFNPCENNETCTDLVNDYSCECAHGYTGKDCTIDSINDCSPDPCQNDGICIDGINSYSCNCTAGFTGAICETNTNDCEPNPCQNNGTCTDGINVYGCTCVTGFTGTDCETNVDDCDPNPCKNGGTCIDGVRGFTCMCNPAYSGADCSGCAMLNCEQCKESDKKNEMGECTKCTGVFVLHQGTCNNNCGIPNCILCDVVSRKCLQCQEGYKINNYDNDTDDDHNDAQCVGKTPEEGGDFKLSGSSMFGVILACIAGLIALILLIIAIIIRTGLHRNKKENPTTYSRQQDEADIGTTNNPASGENVTQ